MRRSSWVPLPQSRHIRRQSSVAITLHRQGGLTMPTLQIIGAPQSNFVWACRIACGEKGVPYELLPVFPHSPEVDAIHPFGKIPVMRHGDVTLCESRAILYYIDHAFPGAP